MYFQTALHWASKHGNTDIVKLLCGSNDTVNVNARTVRGVTHGCPSNCVVQMVHTTRTLGWHELTIVQIEIEKPPPLSYLYKWEFPSCTVLY